MCNQMAYIERCKWSFLPSYSCDQDKLSYFMCILSIYFQNKNDLYKYNIRANIAKVEHNIFVMPIEQMAYKKCNVAESV